MNRTNILYLVMLLLVIPLTSAMEFTENTTFSDKNINYNFVEGVSINSFNIVSDGLLINGNQKFIFVVQGGELDVTFYENNTIGLKASAPQDIIFKITQDSKKQYLKLDGNYYLDDIPVSTNEIKVIPVFYKEGQTEFSDIVTKTISKDQWYQKKFIAFEYDVKTNNLGVIESKVVGLSYFWSIFIFILLCMVIWWLFK